MIQLSSKIPHDLGPSTGCLNMNCQTSNHLLGIKNTLLSHKNGICTFMRCGNLTYDTWIWLKITSLSSTASVLNDGRISLEIPSFCSDLDQILSMWKPRIEIDKKRQKNTTVHSQMPPDLIGQLNMSQTVLLGLSAFGSKRFRV